MSLVENIRPIDHVRNLVASMLQEAIAARDGQLRALNSLKDIKTYIDTALSDRQTGLENAQAQVDEFERELKVLNEAINNL